MSRVCSYLPIQLFISGTTILLELPYSWNYLGTPGFALLYLTLHIVANCIVSSFYWYLIYSLDTYFWFFSGLCIYLSGILLLLQTVMLYRRFRYKSESECLVKTTGEHWVAYKKSDSRELFVVITDKNANLLQIHGES